MKERLARLEQMLQEKEAKTELSNSGSSEPVPSASSSTPGINQRSSSMSVSEGSGIEGSTTSNGGIGTPWQGPQGPGPCQMVGPPMISMPSHYDMPPHFVPSYSGNTMSQPGYDLRMMSAAPASGYTTGPMPFGAMAGPPLAPYGSQPPVSILPPILPLMTGYGMPGAGPSYTTTSNHFPSPPPSIMPAPILPPVVSTPVQLPVQTLAAPELKTATTQAAVIETNEGPSFLFNSPVFAEPYLVDARLYRKLVKTYAKIVWPSLPILHIPTLLTRPSVYPDFVIFVVLASALRFSKDKDVMEFISASAKPVCYTASELAKNISDAVIPVLESRLHKYPKPPGPLEMTAMLHCEMTFGAITGRVLAGLRLLDTMLIMSREIPQVELLKTGRTGDDWIRWEENRRLLWRLFLVDRIVASMSSVRYFMIPFERVEDVPLPCSDELFNMEDPFPGTNAPATGPATVNLMGLNSETLGGNGTGPGSSQGGAVVTLGMFASGLQTYPLFLPQLGSFAKNCVLLFILNQIIDFQRLPIQHRSLSQKQHLEAQLTAWYDCMPAHEQTDHLLTHRAIFNPEESKPPPPIPNDEDGPPRIIPEHLMLFYHQLEISLHSPPRGQDMLENEEWLASDDFVRAAEHASLIISLLQTVDTAAMPLWILEAVSISAQMHILLAKKIAGHPSDELHADLRAKIETAIAVFEKIGHRRPAGIIMSIALKLAMSKIASIDYFADDPPPGDVYEMFTEAVRTALGFETAGEMLGMLESVFGKQGRFLNTIQFFTKLMTGVS